MFLNKKDIYKSTFLLGTIIVFILFAFLYVNNLSFVKAIVPSIKAKEGFIDLSQSSLNNSLYLLDGQWEYYPQELLFPDKIPYNLEREYINVPGTSYKSFLPILYKGQSTYRLLIKIPDTKNNRIGLRTSNIRTDYRMIVNGKVIFENGIFAESQFRIPVGVPRTNYFEVQGNELELIIQISNEFLNNPGISHSVVIGQEELIRNFSMYKNNMDIILFAAMMSVTFYLFLYFVIFYTEKTTNLNYLLLSINTFLFALSTAGYREKLLFQILYIFDTEVLIRFHDLSKIGYYLSLYFLLQLIRKHIYPKIVFNSILVYIIFLFGIVAFIPVAIYGAYFDFLTFIIFTYFILFFTLEIKHILTCKKNKIKINGSFYVLSLITLPTIYSLAIIFYQSKNIWFDAIVSGVIINFMFFMISRTFIDGVANMKKNHQLAEDVIKSELAFLQSQIKPHFLFNTLASIQSMMDIDIQKAHTLLSDLSDYLRSAFDFDHKKYFTTISIELQQTKTYLAIESVRYVDRFSIIYDIDEQIQHTSILQYSIQPLVENALRHGILVKSRVGNITIKIKKIENFIEVHIIDNGVGADNIIFETILAKDSKSHNVGLKNIHNRLLKIYGMGLNIESKVNVGTHVWFRYPSTDYEE